MSARNVYSATLCLLLFMLPVCALRAESDSTLSPNVLARAWIDAWNSHEVDRILTFYTADALYEDVPTVENGWDTPLRGQQMFRESLVKMFKEMPDLSFQLVSAYGAGGRLVVEWTMTGSRYLDFVGEFTTRAVSVIRLEGGRIAWQRDYYDMYHSMVGLGMIPALDSEQARSGGDPATR